MPPFLESFLNNSQVIFFLIDTEAPLLSILSRALRSAQTELLQNNSRKIYCASLVFLLASFT